MSDFVERSNGIEPDPEGVFVFYEDYQKLEAEIERLTAELETARAEIERLTSNCVALFWAGEKLPGMTIGDVKEQARAREREAFEAGFDCGNDYAFSENYDRPVLDAEQAWNQYSYRCERCGERECRNGVTCKRRTVMVDEHPMEWPASACRAVDERDEIIERLTAEVELAHKCIAQVRLALWTYNEDAEKARQILDDYWQAHAMDRYLPTKDTTP